MIKNRILMVFSLLLMFGFNTFAQESRRINTMKKKRQNVKKAKEAEKELLAEHEKIQTKETRKMMKLIRKNQKA